MNDPLSGTWTTNFVSEALVKLIEAKRYLKDATSRMKLIETSERRIKRSVRVLSDAKLK